MYSYTETTISRRATALVAALVIALIGMWALPASADAPASSATSFTVPSVNPCTEAPHELTFTLEVSEHVHHNNIVAHVDRAGVSSDGYTMSGVETAVVNQGVFRASYSDQWVDADGSRFRNGAHMTINFNTGEVVVNDFTLTCLGS